MRKLTTESIINRFISKYGNTYEYYLVDYQGMDTKVKIICKKHGVFEQTPHNHLKFGCKQCGIERQVRKRTGNREQFINRSFDCHTDKYNYSKVDYVNARTKVEIICSKHGSFWQTPDSHLSGQGCPQCGYIEGGKKASTTKKEKQISSKFSLDKFKSVCSSIFDKKYDYSRIDISKWYGLNTVVEIVCPVHGVFKQRAKNHRWGLGCKKCNQSKGERSIKHFLDKTGVDYTTEYIFDDCVDKGVLPFDFAIFNADKTIRCLIEYQGQQHYKVVNFWGKTKKDLQEQQRRDQIKRDYCNEHNLCLLEVSHKQDLNSFFEEAGGLLWK